MFFKRSSKPKRLDDAELIRLYQSSGDIAYVGELYERYVHLVYGVCLKYLRNEEDSKDASMQIFEKLIVELRKHEVANFSSWVHVLSKNYCLMWLRAAKSRQEKEIFSVEQESDMETELLVHLVEENDPEETIVALEKGMDGLPPEQKRCLELFYLEKKSYKEITDLTGYELKKVKSYIQNGKRNLKIYLEKEDE